MSAGSKTVEKSQRQPEQLPATTRHHLPQSPTSHSVAKLAGNQAVQNLLTSPHRSQPLTLSKPGDSDEQQARQVAAQVTSSAPTPISRSNLKETKPTPTNSSPPTKLNLQGGQPLSSGVRSTFEPKFNQRFDHVRIHVDHRAANLAKSVQARAFTLGSHIVFGAGTYGPSTQSGKELIAHELAHVAQKSNSQLRGGADDSHINRDTEVSTSGGFGYVPEVNNTAYEWIQRHNQALVIYLKTQFSYTPLSIPISEMSWKTDHNAFITNLLEPLRASPSQAWYLLPSYIRPDSLVDAVNIGRDCFPAVLGTADWKRGVVDEIARRMTLRLVDSLNRVARIAARHVAREWNPPLTIGISGLPTLAPNSPISQPSIFLGGGLTAAPMFTMSQIPRGIAFSHPIDPYVYAALKETTNVDVVRYRAANPDEFSPAAIAAEERPIQRVQFEFLVRQGLPSWIRVTNPANATVEDVAFTLYGDPTAAGRLIATPPLFGIPAADMPRAITRQTILIDQMNRVASPGPREIGPELLFEHQMALLAQMREAGVVPESIADGRGPEAEILNSAAADQAALLSANRIIPTQGATKALIVERLALIHNNLADMEGPAGQLARPPDAPDWMYTISNERGITREPFVAPETREIRGRLAIARQRVQDRAVRIAGVSDSEALTWDGQTRGQLEIVTTALRGIRVASSLAREYRAWPNIYDLIKSIADGYAGAAETSDLYMPARARLDIAEQRSILFPVTALELWSAQIRTILAEARTFEIKTRPQTFDEEYRVRSMITQEEWIRQRLAGVRAQLLQNPGAAGNVLSGLFKEMQRLQTGASVALNIDTVNRVWQALYDNLSFMGEVRAVWGGGNAELSKAMDGAINLRNDWLKILAQWRSGDQDGAREELRKKAETPQWRTWLNDMTALIQEHQQWDRLMTFAAMVGIAILSGGIGAWAEGAAGAAWGVGAGASGWVELGATGVGVLTEATVFTTLSYPITAGRDPSLGDFASQFGQNILFVGGARTLARGFQGLIGAERAATLGGKLATTGVVTAGFVGTSLLMANAEVQRQQGRSLTGHEAAQIGLENVAFIGATALGSAILRRPLANLRLSGELAGLNFRHTHALLALDATMHEVTLTPEPPRALRQRLIADTQLAVQSEQALANKVAEIVNRADAIVDPDRPRTARVRDQHLARLGISTELANQVRSGEVRSQVLTALQHMQGIRIARALEPVGTDFAIRDELYDEALSYFRSQSDLRVSESPGLQPALDPNTIVMDPNGRISLLPPDPIVPRMDPGGQSFVVQPQGEAPFRVYRRPRGALGEVGGRVELAPTAEAAAGARDPMARPAETQVGGGRASASEFDWGLSQEAIQGVRQALMQRTHDIGNVQRTLRAASIPASREQIAAAKNYLFNSEGIRFDRANYEAWQRLASGRGQVRDVAFVVHELAEIRALEQIRRQTGFDYTGAGFEDMTAQQKANWQADFNRNYRQAHAEALLEEYRYVANAVSEATNGRVRIGPTIAASVDPTRAEARSYMLVDGVPLQENRRFDTWRARGQEIVEIGTSASERLGLYTRTPTLGELVAAVKRAYGPTEGRGYVAITAPGIARGAPGRSGAEIGDRPSGERSVTEVTGTTQTAQSPARRGYTGPWPPAEPGPVKPDITTPEGRTWRYQRYLRNAWEFDNNVDRRTLLTFEAYDSQYMSAVETGGRPGRPGGPAQVSTRQMLVTDEGFTNTENVQLGSRPTGTGNFVDGTRSNRNGGTDYLEVDDINENGLPRAAMRAKLRSEIPALREGDTLLFVDKDQPNWRILYRFGDNPDVVETRTAVDVTGTRTGGGGTQTVGGGQTP